MATADGGPLLWVRGLRVGFPTAGGDGGLAWAVDGVSFSVWPGEAVGIVGESGSGKSVSALALMRLLPPSARARVEGEAWFDGHNLLALGAEAIRRIRGRQVGMVFQDPLSSLNPVLPVGEQIAESLRYHHGMPSARAGARAVELMEMVGIPGAAGRLRAYPHEFSGGMRQRVMIAMALACHPRLLIADEPTTALDVTIQSQILDLLNTLRRQTGMALILITHDLGVVAATCDRMEVMYAGRIVEEGPVGRLVAAPRHPYTAGLVRCVPRLDLPRHRRLRPIPGQPAQPEERLPGCRFSPRCPHVMDRCRQEVPPLFDVGRTPADAPGRPEADAGPAPGPPAPVQRSACWLEREGASEAVAMAARTP